MKVKGGRELRGIFHDPTERGPARGWRALWPMITAAWDRACGAISPRRPYSRPIRGQVHDVRSALDGTMPDTERVKLRSTKSPSPSRSPRIACAPRLRSARSDRFYITCCTLTHISDITDSIRSRRGFHTSFHAPTYRATVSTFTATASTYRATTPTYRVASTTQYAAPPISSAARPTFHAPSLSRRGMAPTWRARTSTYRATHVILPAALPTSSARALLHISCTPVARARHVSHGPRHCSRMTCNTSHLSCGLHEARCHVFHLRGRACHVPCSVSYITCRPRHRACPHLYMSCSTRYPARGTREQRRKGQLLTARVLQGGIPQDEPRRAVS